MSISDYSPHASARRFDSGTPPVPSLYPGTAGLEIIAEVGVPAIEEHVLELGSRLIDRLHEIGAKVVTPRERERRGPLVCIRSTDVVRLCSELYDEARIVTSHRDDALRVALHLYNIDEDVDRVVEALAARRHLLA